MSSKKYEVHWDVLCIGHAWLPLWRLCSGKLPSAVDCDNGNTCRVVFCGV